MTQNETELENGETAQEGDKVEWTREKNKHGFTTEEVVEVDCVGVVVDIYEHAITEEMKLTVEIVESDDEDLVGDENDLATSVPELVNEDEDEDDEDETCDVDGCDSEAVLVDDRGASCETHICTVEGCGDHAVGETDGLPVCDDHMALATADLLDHIDTWGDGDNWSLKA